MNLLINNAYSTTKIEVKLKSVSIKSVLKSRVLLEARTAR